MSNQNAAVRALARSTANDAIGPWSYVAFALYALATTAIVHAGGSLAARGAITRSDFGTTASGQKVDLFTLENSKGMQTKITNYGGIITALTAPDRKGHFDDVVLGYDTLADYTKSSPYFGALIGRFANRIAKGRFVLDGQRHELVTNDGSNTLHGGRIGFDKVVWTVRDASVGPDGPVLTLAYTSPDGEEGYPGQLSVTAIYTLTQNNSLRLDLSATTTRRTIVNLTQHSYFNLRGKGDVLGHLVQIESDAFTPIDAGLIPTGEIKPVIGTPFDFRVPVAIGAHIDAADAQLHFGKGYDHNWVVRRSGPALSRVATVREPETGRTLEISSTEPGLQFYSGNFLDGTLHGKGGVAYGPRSGFCMEPQHFPDAPNQPKFASVVLDPTQTYRNTIVYRFTAH